MSQGWLLPDGSMAGGTEYDYNTPWLFDDPLSDETAVSASVPAQYAFVDPRVKKIGGGSLSNYISNQSTGNNTRFEEPGFTGEWTGGLGLPSWAANGLSTIGKTGLGMMGAPSLITGPLGALTSSLLGDENSTAESVRNKVGNSVINGVLGAAIPGAGMVTGILGLMGFDAMRGLTNLNAPDPEGGGTKAGFWNDTQYGPGVYGGVGSLSTDAAMQQAPTTEYVSGLQTLPSFSGQTTPGYMGGSSSSGSSSSYTSSNNGFSYSGPGSSKGTGGSSSSGSSRSYTSSNNGFSYSGPGSSEGTGGSDSSSSDGGW